MVAVTPYEGSVGECPERSALVLSFLVGKELRIIYASEIAFLMELAKAESAFLRVCKSIVDKNKVIYAPHTLICKRTETGLEHRCER